MDVKPGYKMTEVGVIPEDWDVKSLGRLAHLKNGYAFKSVTYDANGSFRIITIANVQDGLMDATDCSRIVSLPTDLQAHQRLNVGDILISMTGNVGRVCRVSEPSCLLNQRVGKLIPADFDSDLLFLLLGQRPFLSAMATKAKGGAQGNLSVTDITEFQFAVPPTEAEQRAIATALGDVDALLAGLDRLIAKKRDLKQAAMQQLLTGQTRLPGFSGEWEVKRLGDVAELSSGGTPLSSVAAYYDGEIPWVSIADMTKGGKTISCTERNLTVLGFSNSSAQMFPTGTVLYAMYASIGECSIAGIPLCTSQAILGIRPMEKLCAEFLYYYLVSLKPMVKTLGQQGTQANLNKGMVQGFRLGLPGVEEQTAIAAILSDMDAELAALEARRDKTRDLKQGMMQELLTGRTRLV